jgi:hypothetical protein
MQISLALMLLSYRYKSIIVKLIALHMSHCTQTQKLFFLLFHHIYSILFNSLLLVCCINICIELKNMSNVDVNEIVICHGKINSIKFEIRVK